MVNYSLNKYQNPSLQPHQQCPSQSTLRFRVYITSFLTVASFGTMLSMFAMIKDKLNKELQLEQAFLSYLDSLYFIGKILGTLSVLLLSNHTPKKTYFLICALSSLCQLLIPLSINFPSHIGRYMMLLGMVGVGLSKAYVLTPFLFLSQYFNKPQDKPTITVWNSLAHVGDIVGVAITWMGVYQLQLRWDFVYDFCIFGYFLFAVVFYFSVEQKSFKDGNDQKQSQEYFMQESCLSMVTNLTNKMKISYETLKPFYCDPLCLLWCIDYCLQASFIASIIFWFPYYFVQHQFGYMATFIVIAYYISSILGTISFEWTLKKIGSESCAERICFWMIFGEIGLLAISTVFLNPHKDNAGLYVMMVTLMGCLSGGVMNRMATVDFLTLVGKNKKLKYYAIYSSRLLQGVMAIGFSTMIGHFMQIRRFLLDADKHSLFFVMMGIAGLSLLVYWLRKFILINYQKEEDFDGAEDEMRVE